MRLTETHAGSLGGLAAGLVLILVQHFAFHDGSAPSWVQDLIFLVVPALVGGAAAYLTRKTAKQPQPGD